MIFVDKNIKLKNVTYIVNEKCPSFSGIVNQECKGNLWVNDIDTPTIALAQSYAVGGFAFLGTYISSKDFFSLKTFLETELFTLMKKNGNHSFEFSIDGETICENILEMFKDRQIQTEKEFSFRFYATPVWNKVIPKEYQIFKVDSEFWKRLSEGEFENVDFLRNRLLESWGCFEEFHNKSIAYCAVLNNRIVAVIVGTASFNNVITIDIETEEKHRRKGLAYALAVEFIEGCLRKNYIPQWDCVESNPYSYNMAIKLGFDKYNENTVYWFDI